MAFLSEVRLFVAFIALFLFPGYAFLVLFGVWKRLSETEMVCAAGGLSIAVVPLLLYAATYVGISLSPAGVWSLMLVMGGVSLWHIVRRLRMQPERPSRWTLLLAFTFLLTLGTRVWSVRTVDYPLWTDSYHHTIITHLIADTGQVPASYAPYADIDQFSYHFGFHTLAAWFHWLGGRSVPRAVVLVGQFVNALVVPTTYLLSVRLLKDRAAGLIAAWVTGLASHMPALFVNWGRYPQLSGQIFLPVLIVLTVEALRPRDTPFGLLILTGLGVSGLFLVHNRVFLLYGLLVLPFFVLQFVRALRERPGRLRRLLGNSVAVCGVALVVAAPWLWRFWIGFGSTVAHEIAQGYQAQRDATYFQWRAQDLLDFGVRPLLLLPAAAGGVLGIYRRQEWIVLLVMWVALMFAAANSYLINFPPLVSNTIVIILLYLPAAVLIGYLVSLLGRWIAHLLREQKGGRRFLQWGAIAVFLLIGPLGAVYTARLVEPQNGFVRPEDLQAMAWIRTHVPREAMFYVSTHFWTPVVAHGLDAGYWIPLLAERQTILPPEPYGSDGSAVYMQAVNQRARALLEASTPQELWERMQEYGVTHVYVGKRDTYLNADFFLQAPAYFQPLYSVDGVWVFETVR